LGAPGQIIQIRLIADDVYRAGESVSAIERSLRASENFNPCNIKVSRHHLPNSRYVRAIIEDADNLLRLGPDVVGSRAAYSKPGLSS